MTLIVSSSMALNSCFAELGVAGITDDRTYFYDWGRYDNKVDHTTVLGSSGVLFAGGLPASAYADKGKFIDYVKGKINTISPTDDALNAETTSASFIIQTMRRALGATAGYEKTLPATDAQITDWENYIKDESVQMFQALISDKHNSLMRQKTDSSYSITNADNTVSSNDPMYDIMPYIKASPESSGATVFSKNGVVVYAIKNACANMLWQVSDSIGVASTVFLKKPGDASYTEYPNAIYTASVPDASVNDAIFWRHSIIPVGGYDKSSYNYYIHQDDWVGGSSSSSTVYSDLENIDGNYSKDWGINDANRKIITQDDVGKSICQGIELAKYDYDPAEILPKLSKYPCVNIPYDYTLVPAITGVSSGQVFFANQTISVIPNVTNNGPTKNKQFTWTLSDQNATYQAGTTSALDSAIIGVGATRQYASVSYKIPNKPVGTNICFKLQIDPSNESGAKAEASVCGVIGVSPKVQVWGGDILAHGDDDVSGSGFIKANAGSYSEYGQFAKGSIIINSMLSAFGHVGQAKCDGHLLSFNNNGCTNLGGYGFSGDDYPYATLASKFGNDPDSIDISGHPTLGAMSNIAETIIYKAIGETIKITGNISYKSTVDVHNLPQIIIIAKNSADGTKPGIIEIDPDVTRIDAWLIAESTVDTCSPASKVGDCNQQLIINGPVVAKRLKMRRIYTDIDNLDAPAEIFNFRADVLPWSVQYIKSTDESSENELKIRSVKELPPRL